MSSFITPILAKFSAELEAAVENAKANILREFEGLAKAPVSLVKPTGRRGSVRATGQKRTPEVLERETEHVLTVIKSHPGERIEQLAVHAGMSTKDMVLPIKKLRATKRITTAGEKRATTYAPSKGSK
jgi:hypothetical protein